jgi:pyruvate formate-lyase activating enzyme-like uncharacterized protein
MSRRRKLPNGSFVIGTLPISCVRCQQGSKMVLLVTGRCAHECFYCPLSLEKRGRSVTYANEKLVKADDDILFEARSIDAKGTGVTGGDPLLVMEATLRYIRLLKKGFGKRHDIHLYTATPDVGKVRALAKAGLDELRFHPPVESWSRLDTTEYAECVRLAEELGMKAGAEIPAIPNTEDDILKLAGALGDVGARFLNLNELEFSEGNWRELKARGFDVKDDVSSAVKDSEKVAEKVAGEWELDMTLHYCSSGFKDATQLRKRIMRRARNTATSLEIITEDGTFIKGALEVEDPALVVKRLRRRFDIPRELIRHDREKDRIEVAAWILEEIFERVDGEAFIVEEYPTADRLEVERRPLP